MHYIRWDAGCYGLSLLFVACPGEGALRGAQHDYFLLREHCVEKDATGCDDGLDRYGLCCDVRLHGERFFRTRYADFPWKPQQQQPASPAGAAP
jgi:hypothetical protein